ncbi:MAG: hypothetical protein Q8K75_01260 [Chlamydiales bacterium]|nr:hypothetical protein [Chlamydiales bacterium]
MYKSPIMFLAFLSMIITGSANAAITAVNNGGEIIAPPAIVIDTLVTNDHQQGFNEQQGVLLLAPLAVDAGFIAPGTIVNSHMIFLNQAGGGPILSHLGVDWTFDSLILGVMSDEDGLLEGASTLLLGNPGTTYPAPFPLRGMEGGTADGYLIAGSVLTVDMNVAQPGDWIRVITAASLSVPEPSTYLVLTGFLAFTLLLARRRVHA